MKGLVLVEPGRCPANYTDEQIATLAKVPILVVFGDYRDTPTGMPALPDVAGALRRVSGPHRPPQGAGGQAEMLARRRAASAATAT